MAYDTDRRVHHLENRVDALEGKNEEGPGDQWQTFVAPLFLLSGFFLMLGYIASRTRSRFLTCLFTLPAVFIVVNMITGLILFFLRGGYIIFSGLHDAPSNQSWFGWVGELTMIKSLLLPLLFTFWKAAIGVSTSYAEIWSETAIETHSEGTVIAFQMFLGYFVIWPITKGISNFMIQTAR